MTLRARHSIRSMRQRHSNALSPLPLFLPSPILGVTRIGDMPACTFFLHTRILCETVIALSGIGPALFFDIGHEVPVIG